MPYRVMVVDDSRVAYAEISNLLYGSEFELVQHCRRGEEVLAAYNEAAPDLVTMDVLLPGMDGMDVTKKLLRIWPDARVVFITSLAFDDIICEAAAVGGRGLLYKPLVRDTLLAALVEALAP